VPEVVPEVEVVKHEEVVQEPVVEKVNEDKPFSYDDFIDEDDDEITQHEAANQSQKVKDEHKPKVEEDTYGDVVYIDNQREIPENPFASIN